MANFCSACGASVTPDAKFCANCGSALEDAQPRESDLPATEPEQPTIEPKQPTTDPIPEQPPPPPPSSTEQIDSYLANIEASVIRTWRQIFNIPEPEQSSQPPETSAPEPSQPAPEQRNEGGGASRVLKGCGIAVGVVVGLFILLLTLVAIFGEPRDEDNTETPARHASALCDRPAEAAYLRDLDSAMSNAEAGGAVVSRLMLELATGNITPRLLEDLKAGIAVVLEGADEILGLTPPDTLSEIDSEAKRMAREIRASMNLYEDALRDGDGSALQKGTTRINNATGYMESMMEAWVRVCGL